MTARPTLGLLIPAYNAAKYLPRLLASAAAQTDPFDQVWVYDDGSTDDTVAVARGLGAQVLQGSVNLGCSAGKNALARHVEVDWIHFHDADDELRANFGRLARRWMATGRHDVVLFPYEERDDATGAHMGYRRFDPADVSRDARSFAIREQINPFCGLYRRSTFLEAGGYDEDPAVLYNEDVAMHVGLAFSGLAFAADDEVSIINHRRADSMSSANALKCVQAQFAVMRKTAERPGAAAYGREIGARLWAIAGVLSAHLDWDNARAAVTLARRMSPPGPDAGSPLFRRAAAVFPMAALRAREWVVRATRPGQRIQTRSRS